MFTCFASFSLGLEKFSFWRNEGRLWVFPSCLPRRVSPCSVARPLTLLGAAADAAHCLALSSQQPPAGAPCGWPPGRCRACGCAAAGPPAPAPSRTAARRYEGGWAVSRTVPLRVRAGLGWSQRNGNVTQAWAGTALRLNCIRSFLTYELTSNIPYFLQPVLCLSVYMCLSIHLPLFLSLSPLRFVSRELQSP